MSRFSVSGLPAVGAKVLVVYGKNYNGYYNIGISLCKLCSCTYIRCIVCFMNRINCKALKECDSKIEEEIAMKCLEQLYVVLLNTY
jgi:hypothetical protein